jgi:hypothetical protein
MQTRDFSDPEEAKEFCETLMKDNCIDVLQTVDGGFRITWIPNKMFTSFDGKEYVDEVWTKEDGTMISCQDLEPEHAKNIIRMMLRNERERRRVEQEMLEAMQQAIQSIAAASEDDEEGWSVVTDPEINRVLH